jgi:hypothetical protein
MILVLLVLVGISIVWILRTPYYAGAVPNPPLPRLDRLSRISQCPGRLGLQRILAVSISRDLSAMKKTLRKIASGQISDIVTTSQITTDSPRPIS